MELLRFHFLCFRGGLFVVLCGYGKSRMKHRIAFRKLGRNHKDRWNMLRTMVDQLITHERIRTTEAKAKEIRRFADWLVTLGKKGDDRAKFYARKLTRSPETLDKLFDTLGPRYINRPGGFTRICKVGWRRGDNANMAIIEFIDREGEVRAPKAVNEESVSRNHAHRPAPYVQLLNSRNWKLTPDQRKLPVAEK